MGDVDDSDAVTADGAGTDTPSPEATPRPRRRWSWIGVGLSALAVVVAAVVVTARDDNTPAATVVDGPSANSAHQFDGDDHAPFISLADYKPIYDHHDPAYVLVDVRETPERANARIPADIWVPLADMDDTGWRFLEQYQDKTLVLYCDCPWAEAARASVILRAHGFSYDRMRVLHEGIPGWAEAGYPIDSGGDPCSAERDWPQACG